MSLCRIKFKMDENCSSNRSNGEVHVQKQSPSTSVYSSAQTMQQQQQMTSQSSRSPSQQPPQQTPQQQQQQQQSTRFADYFVICGLDLDTGLEPDRFAGKQLILFVCC